MAHTHQDGGANSPLIQKDIRPSTQALLFDPFDEESFNAAINGFQKFRETVEAVTGELETAPNLARDAYWSFEQPVPRPSEEVSAAYRPNQRILAEIMETGTWRELHVTTEGDPVSAAIATLTVLPKAIAALDEQLRNDINELAQAETDLERFLDDADTWRAIAAEHPQQTATFEARAKQAEHQAQQQQQRIDALAPKVEQGMEDQADGMRMAARSAMAAAQQEIENLQDAMEALNGGGEGMGFGLGGSGATKVGHMAQKVELARRLGQSGRFRRVMEIAGRFQRIALAVQKTKVDHSWTHLTGIELGDDLSRVLPAELALADDPLLGLEFDRRFLERQLFQYKLKGNDKVGRGPIVVMLDDSGSMASGFRGMTAEVWAKGAMLGMMAVARHQQRDLVVLHFSGATQLKAFRFLKGQANQAEMIDCIELFFNGGTDLEAALRETLKIIDEAAFDKADVVCISDGITNISETMHADWTRRRQERDMRCYSILIGTRHGAQILERISNEVLFLEATGDDSELLTTIFSV